MDCSEGSKCLQVMRERCDDVLCVVFLQQLRQQVEAEQAVATGLCHQLEEVQQAKQEAAQVKFCHSSSCCLLHSRHLQHIKSRSCYCL